MFETLKKTHNLISHQNSSFHCFLMTFSKKNDYRNPKMMTLPDYSRFFVHPLATLSTVICKNTQIELQHFCSPKKVVPTVFARYNREQLGKYTGKLVVTIDPGIRVWYGMVVYQKDGKTCEGPPLSALQAYNQIISLLFSYYFPSCSLLFPYFSPIVPYCFYYLPIISLLVPYCCPIISLYIISLFLLGSLHEHVNENENTLWGSLEPLVT